MSATPMFDQIKSVLATALTSVVPGAVVCIGQPTAWNASTLGYFWYDDVLTQEHAGPSIVRYTHYFPIHVLVRNGSNADEKTERLMSDIDTAVTDAFMNHRRLSGTAATSILRQAQSKKATGPIYIVHDDAEYRHRFYTLEAAEDRNYNFVNQ